MKNARFDVVRPILFSEVDTRWGRYFTAKHYYRPANIGYGQNKAEAVKSLQNLDAIYGRY